MKKIISILVIVMATVLTLANGAYAQGSVDVSWDPSNCDDCPLPGDWTYRIDIEIYDQCDEGSTLVYSGTNFEDPGETFTAFDLTSFCSGETSDCYIIFTAVKKICPDGQGGIVVVCNGKDSGYSTSCQDLMDPINPVEIPQIELN
ncbi:MAG: hypothetical protein K9G47_06635 [Bacteroidales bacterium]|nr:hypothetical protein [Bacteroidales bacterium]